jgi:acetyl-CoA acetyltransferase
VGTDTGAADGITSDNTQTVDGTGVPGATINRLCGSGMDAIGSAARAINAGQAGLMLAGGAEPAGRRPLPRGHVPVQRID